MYGEGKHRIQLAGEKMATIISATVERKSFIWFLKLSMKNPHLRINKNVGKQALNTQVCLSLVKVKGPKYCLDCKNDVHIAEISTKRTAA